MTTRTEIYIESNRRGIAATAAGDYGTATIDRCMGELASSLEARGISPYSEEMEHALWCFSQGVRGIRLSEKACADVEFGVGNQR